jgi:hypothetical protein
MAEIFISYRREDSSGPTRDLWHLLKQEFETGGDKDQLVFLDIADPVDIGPWPDKLKHELASSSVVLVVIGRTWLTVERNGKRRLEDKNDWVRQEIELALQMGKTIIPVLVDDAGMPEAGQLPAGDIKNFAWKPCVIIRHKGIAEDVENLIKRIMHEGALPTKSAARANAQLRRPETKSRIVCRYELTGLAEAMADGTDEWRGKSTFENIAPEFMQETRALVERKLLEAVKNFIWQPLPDGAVFFIDPGAQIDKALTDTADKAREVVDEYVRFVHDFAPQEGRNKRGLNWGVDIRFVITVGPISEIKGRDVAAADPFVGYTGKPLNSAAFLLRHRDGKGRAFVRRGDVVVLAGATGTKPHGFVDYDELPNEWRLEGTSLVVDTATAHGADTTAWLARRAPVTTEHFRIHKSIVDTLAKRTLTTDEKAEDLLRHVPPSNYADIAKRAKTGARFCIIVGKPGTGKTLCGLRLVAEMMHIDGLDVSIPPVTGETWDRLASQGNADLVVLLDDAFGRTKAVSKDDLNAALSALGHELLDSKGIEAAPREPDTIAGTAPSFLRQRRDCRPALIITVRQDIWDIACQDPAWKEMSDQYAVVIDKDKYSDDDRMALFNNYWRTEDGKLRPSNAALKNAVAEITHPLSIRDFAKECADLSPFEASKEIAKYKTDALERYIENLKSNRKKVVLLWHFLTWTFGGALLEKDEVKKLYFSLARQLGPTAGSASDVWESKQQHYWGIWEDNGYYTVAHPLREEAVDKFFRDEGQCELLDSFFKAFLDAPRALDAHENLKLAAFAAPKAGGKMGQQRLKVIQTASENPNSDAARVLASSIGQAFRNSFADKASAQDSDTRPILIEALKSLLGSPDNAAFGVAFAALCDSFPGSDAVPSDLSDITNLALKQLKAASPLKEAAAAAAPLTKKIRTQNVDHSAWAIASNFSRVPLAFQEQLAALVERSTDDWLRLRAVEAAADYITAMDIDDTNSGIDANDAQRVAQHEKTTTIDKFERYIVTATEIGQPDIMRRGVAGAVEANFDGLTFAAGEITKWLGSADERYNYGFLEWVIWAAGEHLDHYQKSGALSDADKPFTAAILKLARHEDARVRKWLATALAENDVTKENHTLRAVMTRLARDNDDIVRDVAVGFFFEKDE